MEATEEPQTAKGAGAGGSLGSSVGAFGVSWEVLRHLLAVWGLVWGQGLSLGLLGFQILRKCAVAGGALLGVPWETRGISEWSLEGSWPIGGCGKPVIWTPLEPS